jgi:S1-C subfamily serine protease
MKKVAAETPLGIEPQGIKTIVTSVLQNGLAHQHGIKENDTIIGVNDAMILSHTDLITHLQANKNQEVSL